MAESQSVKNTPGRLGVMPGWLHSRLLPRPKCKSRRSATQVVLVGRAEGVLFLVVLLIISRMFCLIDIVWSFLSGFVTSTIRWNASEEFKAIWVFFAWSFCRTVA